MLGGQQVAIKSILLHPVRLLFSYINDEAQSNSHHVLSQPEKIINMLLMFDLTCFTFFECGEDVFFQ